MGGGGGGGGGGGRWVSGRCRKEGSNSVPHPSLQVHTIPLIWAAVTQKMEKHTTIAMAADCVQLLCGFEDGDKQLAGECCWLSTFTQECPAQTDQSIQLPLQDNTYHSYHFPHWPLSCADMNEPPAVVWLT